MANETSTSAGRADSRLLRHRHKVVFDLKPALGVIPDGGAEGVMITEADEMGGFAHWVDGDGKLHRTYSTMAVHQYRQVSTQPLPTGEISVRMQFVAEKPRPGTGGTVSVWANGQQIGDGRMNAVCGHILQRMRFCSVRLGRDGAESTTQAYATSIALF